MPTSRELLENAIKYTTEENDYANAIKEGDLDDWKGETLYANYLATVAVAQAIRELTQAIVNKGGG